MKYYKKFDINEDSIDYLKNKDEKLKKLIELVGNIDREYIPNPFIALINNIIFSAELEYC